MDLTLHPVCNLFPRMPDDEFSALVDDIKEHGIRQPILVHHGQILDGRHRWEAAQKLGIECSAVEWSGRGSLIDTVVSLNLKRRHLTAGQRATAAVEALPFYEAEARERQGSRSDIAERIPESSKGRARDHAAKVFGVNPHYVTDAKTIREKAPERFEAIRAGEQTVSEVKRDMRRQERIERLAKTTPDLEQSDLRPVPLLYCDPPWRYEHSLSDQRRIENQYPTLTLEELKALPIGKLATEDAVLFMWATSPKLESAMQLLEAWGFTYRTCLVWVKDRIGPGYWARQRHELLLVATRGNPPTPPTKPDSVIEAPRGEHSVKPEAVYEMLEAMWPEWKDMRRELFARKNREGWLAWGNEVECESTISPIG